MVCKQNEISSIEHPIIGSYHQTVLIQEHVDFMKSLKIKRLDFYCLKRGKAIILSPIYFCPIFCKAITPKCTSDLSNKTEDREYKYCI